MAFTLWLSADEEQALERIMRAEGTRTKEQAVISAIMDKGALLAGARQGREAPASALETLPVARDVTNRYAAN